MFNVAGRLSACGHCEGVCFFYEDDEDGEDDKNDEDEYQVIKAKEVEIAKEVNELDKLSTTSLKIYNLL